MGWLTIVLYLVVWNIVNFHPAYARVGAGIGAQQEVSRSEVSEDVMEDASFQQVTRAHVCERSNASIIT